jgi:Leucine-rich repeat (LRR) protein
MSIQRQCRNNSANDFIMCTTSTMNNRNAAKTNVLSLQQHSLRTLPSELQQLTDLRSLDVSSNKLQTLPAFLLSLVNLKTLRLDSNKLTELPDLQCLVLLTDLSASCNQLKPSASFSLPASLIKLDLHSNQLSTGEHDSRAAMSNATAAVD